MKRLILSILFMACWHVVSAQDEDVDLQRSIRFAEEAGGCPLVDGYRCIARTEKEYEQENMGSKSYSGILLVGWNTVLDDIRTLPGLNDEQRDLKHYSVSFAEIHSHFIYTLRALKLPVVENVEGVDQVVGLRRETIGQSMKFWVTKDAMVVDSRIFYQ